ncbi:MAG: hypothetical protein KC501_37185 [Myxococcales bacterium]|nr:hypothetical protein [Myxococcales bacterium]
MAARSTIDELERELAARDPELVAASWEIDVTLLRWSLGLTPLERLRASLRTAGTLERLRRGTVAR